MIMDKNSDNIKVMVRVRPLNSRERSEEGKICVLLDDYRPGTLTLDAKPESKSFNFDWVGGDGTTQQNIFEAVGKAMVQTCLEGYNCCIFAYGQTGAGKTYTMQGRGLDMDNDDMTHRGLQPRVFDYIFGKIREDTEENVDTKFLVSCTYLEIYNEQIMDLLEPVGATLQIREDLKKGVYVEGLKEEAVDNSEDTIELLRKGAISRHVGSTNMNMESSRSHSLFTMTIERKTIANGTIHVRTSKFHFVDLAGSERQKSTAAAGERLKEAGNINKSLSVLGQVINSLVEIAEGKQRHIRYRDSKLTFILKDSLGGNSKTCLIANISPASSSFAETLSTLKFAQRAKQIKNKASINEDSTGSVEGLKNEIRLLKEELGKCRSSLSNYENGGMQMQVTRSPPKLTPHSNNFGISPEAQRALYEQNQRSMELEIQLKQTIEVLSENELLLQVELDKKEEYLNMFKSAVDLYENNEVQYRSVILLNRSKAERLSRVVAGKISEMNYNMLLEVENTQLKKENSCVVEILRSTPLIMKIFRDNVEMRERIEVLESEFNPNSTLSIAKQIHDNLFYLQQLTLKIEEDIKERRVLNDRLERINGGGGSSGRGGMESPEKHRRLEDDIRQLKLEHGQQIDRLNFEILELRGLEMEARRIAEIGSKKHFDLLREYESLKESKQRNEQKYENKMNELYQEFQNMQLAKFDVDGLESQLDQMNLKCLEYKEQAMSYKEKYEDMLQLYQEMEECVKNSLLEKETNEREYREEVNRKDIEKGILENNVVSLENKLNIAGDDLAKYKEELDNLTKTLSEFYSKENEYNLQLDSLYHENIQQTEKFAKIEEQKNEQIMQAQAMIEKQKMGLETLESERNKIQEELDTLSQILNYNIDELEGKKSMLLEAHGKIGEQEKQMNDMKEEMMRQKEFIENLQQQIYDQNHESSPYNLALKENARLNEQLTQVSVQIRALETESDQRKEELCEAKLRINELNESVQDYTSAYKDAMSKLEVKSGELKETQNNLELRVAEMAQLEQELKASNDNTMKREKELEVMNESLKTIEKNKIETEKELNMKRKENEELMKKISVLEADIEEMKAVLENKVEEHKQEIERQKKLFEEKLEEIQKVKGELKRAEEKIEDYLEEIGGLESAKETLQKELETMKESHLKQIGEMEQAKKDLQEEINKKEEIMEQAKKDFQEELNKKEEIINGLNVELEAMKKIIEEKTSEIEEGKKRINEEGEKIAELERQGLVKEEDIKKYVEEIEKTKLRNEELENEIEAVNKTIETEYIKKEEYNKQVGEMQTLLKEQEGHHEEMINKLREEYDKEQEKITVEKAEREEVFARKEQEYEQQLDETTAKLNEALAELAAGGIREMKEKIEQQENDINEYAEVLNQMKGQIEHCVQAMEQLTEENDRLKEESERLKGDLKNEKELVMKMNIQAAGIFRQQEIELAKMRELFDKLNEQHQFIMATVSIKEGEITKCRDEIRLMLLEKEKMLDDIMKLRENEMALKQAKEESDDKVSLLNNEKLALMVQLDTVEKANSQLIGHNNKQQKVDYLTKLKEEGNKLRDEKVKLQERLNKAQEKSEQLQKKLDELARKNNLDPAKLASEISESQYLMHELEKIKVEHKLSNEVLVMLNELLNESFYNRKSRSNGYHHNNKNETEKDLNKVLENVQKYLKILKEKEREVREKERDMDARKLQHSIIERELAIIKQKFKVSLANPNVDAEQILPTVQPQAQNHHYHPREDKENDQKENSHNHSSAKKKAELNIDRSLQAHNITGLKRNLDELITGPSNKPKVEKTERKLAMGSLKFKKDKREKMAAGKESVGRLSEIPAGMKQEDEEMLRNSLNMGDEYMTIGFEELKKKMKMENN